MKVRKIIGHFVDIDEKDQINKAILEKHITHYMASVSQVMAATFILIMIFEIVVTLLVRAGHFQILLIDRAGMPIDYITYVKKQILFELVIWGTFGIYYLFWRKAVFSVRKTLIVVLTLILTTVFCFYHWKNNSLAILYVIPTIIAIPLDKRRNKAVMFFSILLIFIYSVYQFSINRDEANFLIALSSITTIGAMQLICKKIHNTMNRSFLDIKAYAIQQKVLFDKLSHDELTGAYSKTALDEDIKNLENYNSLSFIDVDNFKSINDNYDHQMGDNILKLLVFCMETNKTKIYRNGGDEFIVLSALNAKELGKEIQRLKTKFTYFAEDFYQVKATVSVGIININKDETGSANIKRCDSLMYKSKKNGKDSLTMEE